MTTEYIDKRMKSFSKQLDSIKDKMAALRYELERQGPYDDKITDHLLDSFNSAYIDVKEAIDKLDTLVVGQLG